MSVQRFGPSYDKYTIPLVANGTLFLKVINFKVTKLISL